MSILWYIGETSLSNQSVLDGLCSNYALRKFKTPESLISLFSVIQAADFDHPFAMVADFAINAKSKKDLESFSLKNFECSPIVYIQQAPPKSQFTIDEKANLKILSIPLNEKQSTHSLNEFLADILRVHNAKRHASPIKVCYKDDTLDYTQLEYRIDAYNEV